MFKSRKKSGITLVENLVTIVLLTIMVITTIGGFAISKMGSIRANHRTVAMGLVREYMEKEASQGYYFGQYYTFASAAAVTATIDGVTYSITPEPYPATGGTEGGSSYKVVGFRVTWNEPIWGGAGSVQCTERAATYIARHT